jgi:hypothetical protein
MATEDDTFRILSRPSWNEMRIMYLEWMTDNPISISSDDEFMKVHGWTLWEWEEERRKRFPEIG